MAFQSVPETAEIVVRYTQNAKTVINVFAARLTGGYVLADLEALASTVDVAIDADWLPIQTDSVSYLSTTVRGLESINDLEAVDNTNAGPGAIVEVGVSGNVCFAIKKSSGQTGRSARGRTFFFGFPRSNLQGNLNLMDDQPVIDITAAVDAIRAAIALTDWTPVIVSRFTNGLKRTTGETFTWIDSVAVDNEVDSMRPRLAS